MAATLIFRVAMWQCGKSSEIVWQKAKICHTATVTHYICHTLECGSVAGVARSTEVI